jgi:hypothetical protein
MAPPQPSWKQEAKPESSEPAAAPPTPPEGEKSE